MVWILWNNFLSPFADNPKSLIRGYAINPASQRAIAPIVAERAIDSHEGFLRGILCIIMRNHQSAYVPVNRFLILHHQHSESVLRHSFSVSTMPLSFILIFVYFHERYDYMTIQNVLKAGYFFDTSFNFSSFSLILEKLEKWAKPPISRKKSIYLQTNCGYQKIYRYEERKEFFRNFSKKKALEKLIGWWDSAFKMPKRIVREYYYGYCRVAYCIYDNDMTLQKPGMDFFSILSLSLRTFKPLEDRNRACRPKPGWWMVSGSCCWIN